MAFQLHISNCLFGLLIWYSLCCFFYDCFTHPMVLNQKATHYCKRQWSNQKIK